MPQDNNNDDSPGRGSAGSGCGGENMITTPMPKHIPFPDFPGNSEIMNELLMFLFVTGAAAMQFINIYRTVWWLPESHTTQFVSYYKIEPYLIALLILMAARRFVYCVLLRALELIQKNRKQRLYRNILKYTYGSVLMALLAFCVLQIYLLHTYITLFLLVYPLVVYIFIFGFQIEPFIRSLCVVEGAYFNNMPMHCCSSNPSTIRDEIEVLRNDFNNRFKQVIFTSVLNAYYAGFVPCFFAVTVYYNMLWATQHVIFIWLSGITMCTVYIFPSKYSDILHRASLHLGFWSRLTACGDGENAKGNNVSNIGVADSSTISNASLSLMLNTSPSWNKSLIWTNGSVVKHCGELFRCLGPVTVAQPANSSHTRFYKLFHNPSIIYQTLTTVQATIVLLEIILLYFAIEWHFVLSISFITLTNQFTFFKTIRDYLITKRVYTAEMSITEKQLNSNWYTN